MSVKEINRIEGEKEVKINQKNLGMLAGQTPALLNASKPFRNKIKRVIPNGYGHQLCPYCKQSLVPIVREWMKPPHIDYVCHHCQIRFEILLKGGIEKFDV